MLLFGIIAGQSLHDMTKVWVTASMTLFVVALVLLVLIMRDQRTALTALTTADDTVAAVGSETVRSSQTAQEPQEAEAADGDQPAAAVASDAQPAAATDPKTGLRLAAVERGRIASMGGVTALIWLVILVLMVWH